ncbi:hypothetical protein WKI13_14835 [Teredinibacter turnerae]|uniref:hypothetical protein n=1 Tax=Teredinibacter turnerae TaxID=2426 RepID=UPI00035E2A01|nr:hypothetical protein [Teredinibacter turnerae]
MVAKGFLFPPAGRSPFPAAAKGGAPRREAFPEAQQSKAFPKAQRPKFTKFFFLKTNLAPYVYLDDISGLEPLAIFDGIERAERVI